MNVYKSGNTVRLLGEFYDFNGELKDPQLIKVVIYDYKYNIVDTVPIGDANRLSVGKYYYDFSTKKESDKYIYEWYGEIDGNPSLDRRVFMTKFI